MRLSLLAQTALAALAAASTLTPSVVPLIVRNPYLSTWLHSRGAPWEAWPIFWTGNSVGFSMMASVRGEDNFNVYPLLGRPQDSLAKSHHDYNVTYPEYLGVTFDASTTNLTYLITSPKKHSDADPLKLTLSFLSPITPSSTLRQSLPAAYLNVFVEGSFDVDIYIDLNGEWVSGNRDNRIEWKLQRPEAAENTTAAIKSWQVSRRTEQLLTEFDDRAEWGNLFFSAPADVRHQSGVSRVLRQQFSSYGHLTNAIDQDFRKIMDEEPVFAFSKSFRLGGGRKAETDSVMFTFALVQDPVVQFASARGLTLMKPFYATYFPKAEDMISYHYMDFRTASALARNYSAQLDVDALASGSSDYRDIAALSARQVLGATQFSGTPDNPIIFLKEISSNGNFQTVDVIFPAFPFFLYTNPRWLAYLLEPLLEHQLSGQYPNNYSMHDLGYHFPNATGHDDGNDEYMPVEECGNMLIMGLALVNAYKYDTLPAFLSAKPESDSLFKVSSSRIVDEDGIDTAWGFGKNIGTTDEDKAKEWAKRSYTLWKKWTVYLVDESLVPRNQLSTDDFAGWLAFQTNLALKGIIGIKAMSKISETIGEEADAEYYRNISKTYIEKWQEYGLSRDKTFAKLAYDWFGSWTTLYNLYADSLLCFRLPEKNQVTGDSSGPFIPDYVYKMQSDWYYNVHQEYGLPLDSRHTYTKSDWEFFAAAVTGKKTRTELLTNIAKWVNETVTDKPFTDLYETIGQGGYPGFEFKARPVIGGHFAFLALERACGGKATDALQFLDAAEPVIYDVQMRLSANKVDGARQALSPWEETDQKAIVDEL